MSNAFKSIIRQTRRMSGLWNAVREGDKTLIESYDTVVEAINELRGEGYAEDFNLMENCIECRNGKYKIFHDEFKIDKYFRFDDNTSPLKME